MKKSELLGSYFCVALALSVTVIFGCRCNNSKPSPDPLVGWRGDFSEQPNSVIVNDYQSYIKQLPSEDGKNVSISDWLINGTGEHAVVIELAVGGTWWRHILIYDKDNKRIKIIKYSPGKYRS